MKWLKQAGVFKSSTEASPVRKCVSCLYSIGYGVPKIERVTGYNRGASIKWLKKCGIYAPERAAARRDRNAATAHRHKRDAKFPLVLCAFSVPCRVEKIDMPRETASQYVMRRYYSEPEFRIKHLLRCRVRLALRGKIKSGKTMELLGCSVDQLKSHFEKMFREGMKWENMGAWEIDHIKPCNSFNLNEPEQQRVCFHFSNLQPLWKKDNRRKWATCPL